MGHFPRRKLAASPPPTIPLAAGPPRRVGRRREPTLKPTLPPHALVPIADRARCDKRRRETRERQRATTGGSRPGWGRRTQAAGPRPSHNCDVLLASGPALSGSPGLLHSSRDGALLLFRHLSTTTTRRGRGSTRRPRWPGLGPSRQRDEGCVNLGEPGQQCCPLGLQVVDNGFHGTRPLSLRITRWWANRIRSASKRRCLRLPAAKTTSA